MKNKMFVLGIDGVPYSLLKELIKKGRFQNLQKIIDSKCIKEIKSVYPVISSVAWTSYATGVNPGEHGIFGFIDRSKKPFHVTLQTSRDRKAETIWTTLSKQGKKVVVINVPITYPVEKVNGKMVSCFLCPDIHKGTYPPSLVDLLEKYDYIIDADAWLVREDKEAFLKQLFQSMDARFKVSMDLLEEEWDYFQLHIMETDRLMHFFWYDIQNENSEYYSIIAEFFECLDRWIGKLIEKLGDDIPVCILSDHGFCGIKHEVQMNTWLREKGYLVLEDGSYNLDDYNEKSLCYSLMPGRFFVNLKGREEKGSVPIEDYDKVREKLKEDLLKFKNPENGENIIKQVFYREEIYSGANIEEAADLIAHPNDGYDLKGMLKDDCIFTNNVLTGMHTYDDAVIIGKNFDIRGINSVMDVRKEILRLYGICGG